MNIQTFRYNRIRANTNEVEFSIIKDEMKNIDAEVLKAETDITWSSGGKYIKKFSLKKCFFFIF